MTASVLEPNGLLSDDAIESFAHDGFLIIERLVDDEVLARLRQAYDEIIERGDQVKTSRHLGGITRQVMVPSMHHPMFDRNPALDAARRIVGQLYGANTAARTYDMLIDKPAGHPHATPWHQDAGYFGRPVALAGTPIIFRSVQVWLALDDVDAANGCMQFVPGHHGDGVLEHCVIEGDPDDEGRLIGLVDPPTQVRLEERVVAELAAGGCTMHLAGTPHFTGPNNTVERSRRAYIFNLDPSESTASPLEARLRANYVTEIGEARRRSERSI